VADGLGVRVRARSFTEIDQRSGDAVTWTRLSYYAGIAPSGGLTFSAEMAVYPILAEPDFNSYGRRTTREIEWAGMGTSDPAAARQHLTSGWLQSRTPTQFLTVRARKSELLLEVSDAASAGDPPQVTNRLQTRIERLFLLDSRGSWFVAEDVADQTAATLQPSAFADVQQALSTLESAHMLRPPEGLTGQNSNMFGFNNRRWYGPQSGSNYAVGPSLLERSLTDPCGIDKGAVPPRSYIAIVEHSPEVEHGVSGLTEEASFHMIVGRW
jgi:hypothetical protein